jgi:ketosteroid isomerase-like protein
MSAVSPYSEIEAMVERETAAWDRQDATALVDLFHPDMVWPWPPDSQAHDPARWVFPQGRFDRERWKAGWRRREDGALVPWKGRACKGYTKVGSEWRLIFHTGLLEYER